MEDTLLNRKIILWPLIFYVAAQIIANVASVKIGVVFGFEVDMGVFIYPITFTLRDLVHRTLGKEKTAGAVVFTGLANLFLALYLLFIGLFNASASSPSSADFDLVMMPALRIVFASIIAQIISELVDTEVYHRFVQKFGKKHKWARVLVSNSISIPIDNLIFCFGAFLFSLPLTVVWGIFAFNLAVKYVISLVSIPMIYMVHKDEE